MSAVRETTWRDWLYIRVIRPILFLFDAETTHNLAIRALAEREKAMHRREPEHG